MKKIVTLQVKKITLVIMFLLLLSSLRVAFSNSQDPKSEPLRVDADSLQHDDKNLITTFEGNVVLTRNNLIIKGDVLKLQQTEDGLAFGHIIGKPALFKQKREVYGDWIEGRAERLDYDERNSMFFLTGNASLKRKMNGQIKDEVSGDKLSYSSLTEIYKAETVPGETRTRMTLMPRRPKSE